MSSDRRTPKPRPRPKPARKKDRSRESRRPNEIWLTGLHAVREALRARRRPLHQLWIRDGKPRAELTELVELAGMANVPVKEVSGEDLLAVAEADSNPQGVALEAGALPEFSIASLLDWPAISGPGRRYVALDGVEDPQNVGAIARVAESAGASGLILTQRRAPALTPSVARASAGAIDWLPVGRVPNLSRALVELQKSGFWVLAAATDSEKTLFEMEDRFLTGDLVVVLGAEGKGVRQSILDQSDYRVEIPMRGRIESLNVSTAGAVLLFELLRRAEGGQPR